MPAVGGLFFPQSKSLGIDQGEASPALLQKITYAGTACRSFGQGSDALWQLADLPIPEKQVERVTERIGAERLVERAAAVTAFQRLPLVEKFAVPAGVTPPTLAVVMVDGGRLQILDRRPPVEAPADAVPPAEAAATADATWDEEEAPDRTAGHWREDKIGLLLTMQSAVAVDDPCPEIPAAFVDRTRIPQLVRELKQSAPPAVAESDAPEAGAERLPTEAAYEPPQVQQRTVVATRRAWPSFAPVLAQAAWERGFQGAPRKAFVGDGSANNWRLQRRFFGSFVPILDFIHALSYVFAAAQAGRAFAAGWACYEHWIGWVWQGQVVQVIAALEQRQNELGLPAPEEPETSPAQVVATALTYLRNQQDKMRYDAYRQQGLPLTSSLMESVVKQVNLRVKGTEKFWSEAGAEAILQLRADHLSDDQPLEAFWERRQAAATGQRHYRRAS